MELNTKKLKIISNSLRILGYLMLLSGGIIGLYGLYLLIDAEDLWGILLGVSAGVAVNGLVLLAVGELIILALRIERNTAPEAERESAPTLKPFEKSEAFEPFSEWSKKNPGKTRNDFYASLRKNQKNP